MRHVAESRSTLCNKNVGPIILQPLYDVKVTLVMYIWIGLQSIMYIWLGHNTITTMGSLVIICGHVCIVGDYSNPLT